MIFRLCRCSHTSSLRSTRANTSGSHDPRRCAPLLRSAYQTVTILARVRKRPSRIFPSISTERVLRASDCAGISQTNTSRHGDGGRCWRGCVAVRGGGVIAHSAVHVQRMVSARAISWRRQLTDRRMLDLRPNSWLLSPAGLCSRLFRENCRGHSWSLT